MNVNNTNVTMGVFEGDSLRATWRFATDVRKTGDEYGVLMSDLLAHGGVSPDGVDSAVIGCVVPDLEPVFEGVCKRYFEVKPLVVGTGGYAELIARETDAIDAVDMDLALKGLRLIFEMNRG